MKKLFTLFIGLGAIQASAQIIDCNVFMQGNYVEVGVSPVGSYGSSVYAPSTYHAHNPGGTGSSYHPCGTSTTSGTEYLGFVCDYGHDGWTVGTPPYMGDYFLPGTPFEGWEMQFHGGCTQAFNMDTAGFVGTLTSSGSNISYSASAASVTSTWQGVVDSVQLTQVTTIDTGDLFFTMQVTFTNLSSTPVNDIYYLRTLDPDNDETWTGGGFTTTNTIAHQVADTTVVTAAGATGAYTMMALGTTDTNARCFVYGNWPIATTVDISTMYNETYSDPETIYTQGSTNTGDNAIGLIYHIAHLASVDSAADSVYRTTSVHGLHPANTSTITFFYAFNAMGLDSAMSRMANSSTTGSLKVKNVNANTGVKVYPNPSNGLINVSGLNAGDQVSLIDMMGNIANLNGVVSGTGNDNFTLNGVPAGNYLLQVKDLNGNVTARVNVQKQ